MQDLWLEHCDRIQVITVAARQKPIGAQAEAAILSPAGGKFPVSVIKLRGFQGSKVGSLKRGYVHSCICVHVYSLMCEVSKALPCCSVI